MRRPVIPFGGTLGQAFKQVWDALERNEAAPSPDLLTSKTTRGVVRRPSFKAGQQRTIAERLIVMEAPFMDPSLPAVDYNYLACAYEPEDLDTAQLFTDYAAAWQVMRDAHIAGDADQISAAQSAWAEQFVLVEVPEALGQTAPQSYYGNADTPFSSTVYRLSMNTRAVVLPQGPDQTLVGVPVPAVEQVIDPPYFTYANELTPTWVWGIDPTGGFARGWGRTLLDWNREARRWVFRAQAENNLKAKNGVTLYPVGGHDIPASRWTD